MSIERLKQQWIPISTVKKISSKPQRFMLFDLPLVLYRVKDKIIALQDRCPHRGIPLSAGKLHGEQLQCAYHGWRFNPSGECAAIPGLVGETNLSDKCVPAFPTQIYMGLVFVCLNKNEHTLPLYDIPAQREQQNRVHLMQFDIQGDILNIIENTLDATHTHYVHSGLIRQDSKRQTITAKLSVSELCAEVLYEEEQKQSGLLSSLFENNRKSSIGRFHFPLIAELEYHGKDSLNAAFTFFLSPSHNNEHRAFLLISYRYNWKTSWLKKLLLLPFIKMAVRQDLKILEKQDRNLQTFPDNSFKSTELDILRPHIERILENKAQTYNKMITLKV
jgi:phenylpropionate dioxygenase-like ring-hydroxylating dioxygenase large terminal subunit